MRSREGRAWLDPIEIAALFEAYAIPDGADFGRAQCR